MALKSVKRRRLPMSRTAQGGPCLLTSWVKPLHAQTTPHAQTTTYRSQITLIITKTHLFTTIFACAAAHKNPPVSRTPATKYTDTFQVWNPRCQSRDDKTRHVPMRRRLFVEKHNALLWLREPKPERDISWLAFKESSDVSNNIAGQVSLCPTLHM